MFCRHIHKPLLASRIVLAVLSVVPAVASDNPLDFSRVEGLSIASGEISDACQLSVSGKVKRSSKAASLTGGDNGCSIKLAITVVGSVETHDAGYDHVYVNDVLFFSSDNETNDCTMSPREVTKVVTVNADEDVTLTYDTLDGKWQQGAFATITKVELVEEGCSSGCEPGGAAMENGSVHFAMNLGRTLNGESVGALRMVRDRPSAVLGTPASLSYSSAWSSVEVIMNGSDAIRQVRAPQCLADVITETSKRFRVDFYNPANIGPKTNGLYDQAGKTSYVSWVVENLDPADNPNGHLKITQMKGASSVLNEYLWNNTDQGWELREGNGQRKSKKAVVTDSAAKTRTVTLTVYDSTGATDLLVFKRVNTYKEFPWGDELITSVIDPGGANLTTTRTFYDNASSDGEAYGRLKSETSPDGGWARYEYDALGRRVKTVQPFLDATPDAAENQCKVTTVTYDDTAPQETHVVTIMGQEVARNYRLPSRDDTYKTREIRCTVAGAAHDASSNLVTTTEFIPTEPEIQKPKTVSRPDGTGMTYAYSTGDLNGFATRTVIIREGALVAGVVTTGTQTTTVTDVAGNLLSETTEDIASDLVVSQKTVTSSDSFGRPLIIDYNDGTTETINYGCCGVDSRTDREGITTTYTYDAFKRVLSETQAGITTAFKYDPEGRILERKRIGSDESVIIQETNTYDLAGRLLTTKDALGWSSSYSYSTDAAGRQVETITHPDGGTTVTVRHRDGRLYSVTGTAVAPRQMLYGVDDDGYFEKTIRLATGGGANEWTTVWQDLAGREVASRQNGKIKATRHYNAAGHLVKTVDSDGVVFLYTTDVVGDSTTVTLDVDRDEATSAADRVETTRRSVVADHNTVVHRTERKVVNVSGSEVLAGRTDVSTDGRGQWSVDWGRSSSRLTTYESGGTRTETLTRPDGASETRVYVQGRLVSEVVAAAGGSPVLRSATYAYDAHGRRISSTDARNGKTTYTYDAMDRVSSVTTPAPAQGMTAQTTQYFYDPMGRTITIVLPDGSETATEYFPNGSIKKTSGSQVPTVEYTYDAQGRRISMTTTGQAGPATTTWTYDAATGWLTGKGYPGGDSISYTYSDAGRLVTRTTGRGVTRTYTYDQGGRQTGINYSDATPDVVYTLNRLGQIIGVSDGIGTRTRSVSSDGRLLSETHTTGLLQGASTDFDHDSLLRRSGHSISTSGGAFDVDWTYDGLSRLANVTAGVDEFSYIYGDNSGLVTGILAARDGTLRLTRSSSYDKLNRLTSISSTADGVTVSSHAYTYNELNHRTDSVLEDGKEWAYGYDDMGQVVSGTKKTDDGVVVPGMSFQYAYDGIGNRTSVLVNGRPGTYTSNLSNQYTSRQVPGALDIRGTAAAEARVTVNTEPTQRLDEYFYKSLAVDNSASPQYVGVSVLAVRNNAGPNGEDVQSERTGYLYLAKTPEVFTYDAEGNLTSDGRWNYTWDGENRLIAQETIATVPVAAKRRLLFAYDAESRRVRKRVFEWNDNAWELIKDIRFLYDGWNLTTELDATNTITRTYVWGLDLSGTLQGAGGVGGLLAIREGTESHLPCYDGNGNVMALVKASDATVSARYEYGPFGESLVVEENGIANPFRFSTKYQDGETGLLYYGYRYYDPLTGRWPSRDPIGESGGVNLYGFVYNTPVTVADVLGLSTSGSYSCECDRKDVNKKVDEMSKNAGQKSTDDLALIPDKIKKYGHSVGREWGGRICCNKKTKEVSSTGPISGAWDKQQMWWRGRTVNPKDAPACSTKGDDWVDAAYYHSHPAGSTTFSGDDVTWSHGLGGGLPLGLGTPDGKTRLLEPTKTDIETEYGTLKGWETGNGWNINNNGTLTPNPSVIPKVPGQL